MTAIAGLAVMLSAQKPAPTRRAVHPPAQLGTLHATQRSLLDALPRVANGGYARALEEARARGAAGAADALWIQFFYGAPEAQAAAERALQTPRTSDGAELAFLRFLAAYTQGQDRQMLQAALHLTQTAPDDVASELAVRMLSGQLENQGRELLNAVPLLQKTLEQPLADPTTRYMLGRSLLAAVHAPGLALTQAQALDLAGRLPQWQLWGPFGKWENLDFDRTFEVEKGAAASYTDDTAGPDGHGLTRTPRSYDSGGLAVNFPLDWGQQGIDFAVTYVHAARPERVLLRMYSQASVEVEINGQRVLRTDRRSSYTPATNVAAIDLTAGWSRVVVKLGGEAARSFDLMLRPESGAELEDTATPPNAALATAPRLLAPPPTLAAWSAARLQFKPNDAVALWVDGVRRTQDEDGEHAVTALEGAAKAAPRAAPVWLDLADSYGELADASQSWVAAQTEAAAQHALQVSPHALRAHDRLGHVYESQGKMTQAAEQYQQCAAKGDADCDWSEFRLASRQRWLPEAEAALGHALADSGSDWNSIVAGLEFYAAEGEAQKIAEWERVLSADPRASAALAGYELRHGRAPEAVRLYRTALQFQPSSPDLARDYLEALRLAGDPTALTVAQAELAQFPDDWRVAEVADEINEAQGSSTAGAARLRATDYNRNILRHEADFLANRKFWQPWYHSAQEIIRDAPGKEQYPNASAILVFDQMVDRINPDSTQDQYIHQIYRVLNATGIEQLGDVTTVARGSDLITIRTIKQDGRVLLPERIANITSITMPGLEPGDYIEIEFVQHTPASAIVPGTLDNSEFFVFNSSTQPYHYSNYIVLTPPGYPLLVDQERFPSAPTVQTLSDGWTARAWLVQKTRMLVPEPHMPPEQNLVPKVWVSSQSSWDEVSTYFADHMDAIRKVTPAMQLQADSLAAGKAGDIAKADAIFDWVAADIQPGEGSIWTPARQSFADRSGNRLGVFQALLAAARVPYQLVFARAVTDDSSTRIPSLFQFQYPLVHVGGAGAANSAAGWYDLNGDFAQLQYIVPTVRGGLALVAGEQGAADFTHVPQFSSNLDGVVVTVNGNVEASGDAHIHLELTFRGPTGEQVRNALANQPESVLPQVYQQMLLANYPNATSTGGAVQNMKTKHAPLIIGVDATVPGFIHSDTTNNGTGGWDIDRLIAPVGLLARYAQLPFRNEPLVIPAESYEQTQVTLTLAPKFGKPTLPAGANVATQYGTFSSQFSQTATLTGDQIRFSRLLDLRASLVPPSGYAAFRSFGEVVDNQDHLRITGGQ